MKKLICLLLGHDWVARHPEKHFRKNGYDCVRCGKYAVRGFSYED